MIAMLPAQRPRPGQLLPRAALPVAQRFDDGVIDFIPEECIVPIVGEGCSQKRLNTVEVEVVGADGGNEFQEIIAKGAITCL